MTTPSSRRCTECGRSLARASAERARAGLKQLDTSRAKTCGRTACIRGREKWRKHEAWAKRARPVAKRSSPETRRCSECGIDLRRADLKRMRAGLPRLDLTRAKTCGSSSCVLERETRCMRDWWSQRPRLIAKRLPDDSWRCSECGIDLASADKRRARVGLPPIDLRRRNVTCGPKCYEARELRRYIVRHGHPPRRVRRT